jgi:3-phytase
VASHPPPATVISAPRGESRQATPAVKTLLAALLTVFLALGLGAGCSSSSEAGDGGAAATDTDTTTASTGTSSTTTSPSPSSSGIAAAATPFAETPDLVVGKDDEADDTAIHPDGYVIGTSKNARGGLEVYDLDAKRLQWLELGKTNNVDLRGSTVVSSNRGEERVDILSFANGRLALVRSFPVPFNPYGICLYRDTVVVTANEADNVEQYSLDGRLLRKLSGIESQAEGCVADEARGVLYVGEEERGVWRFAADPEASPEGTLVDEVGEHLEEDVEGLTLFGPFLIVSSQGDSTFAVYRNDRFVASFRIPDTDEVDGATSTDGIAAHAGLDLLVVHDAHNADGASSNYKYVRLSDIFGG